MPTKYNQWNTKKNNTIQTQNDDENNFTFASFVEIFSACFKVGVFVVCIYILKEIFLMVNELFLCIDGTSLETLKLQIIPTTILLILAAAAFWIMSKD